MSRFEIVDPRGVQAFGFLAGDDPAIRPVARGNSRSQVGPDAARTRAVDWTEPASRRECPL